MQTNEFEKNIQQTLEAFKLVPGDDVWNKVAIRIAKKEKRRRFILWFFTCTLLLGGSFLWLLKMNKNQPVDAYKNHIIEKNEPLKNALNNLPAANVKKNIVLNSSNQQTGKYTKTGGQIKDIVKNNRRQQNRLGFTKATFFKRSIDVAKNNDIISKISSGKNTESTSSGDLLEKQKSTDRSLSFTPIEANKILSKDTIRVAKNIHAATAGDSTLHGKTDHLINAKNKKWHIGFNVYAGIADNKTMSPQAVSETASFSSPGVNVDTRIASNLYASSLSFGVGGFFRKWLNEKFYFSAGLDYHFYQAKSLVGNRISKPFSASDLALSQGISVNEFYRPGTSAHFSNQYHLLELPLIISYKINQSKKRPAMINAGISPCWLIGTRALFDNKSKNILYTDNTQFHRFQFSFHTAVSFTLKDAKGYQIEAGPVFQYQFTNLSKPVNAEKQQLIFTGIKTNFILK